MSNVIRFPLKKIRPATNTGLIEQTMSDLVPRLFHEMVESGFDVMTESSRKDAALVSESIRSLLMSAINEKHALQRISNKIFEESDDSLQVSREYSIAIHRNFSS